MKEPLVIIVTGAPAAGKTTLSRNLAERFNLPVVNKDEIKELLYEKLGIQDVEWGMKLGAASFELMFMFIEKLLKTGKPFIVEGNFDNRYSTKSFMEIKRRINYRSLQLYCHAQDEVLYDRYISRDASGDRHPGHLRLTASLEEYRNRMLCRNHKLDIEGSINVDIDTTDFNAVDLQEIYDKVEKAL